MLDRVASEALVEGCSVDHRPIGVLGGFSCLPICDIVVLPRHSSVYSLLAFEYYVKVSTHVGYAFSS